MLLRISKTMNHSMSIHEQETKKDLQIHLECFAGACLGFGIHSSC